jgi:hypothetical protein
VKQHILTSYKRSVKEDFKQALKLETAMVADGSPGELRTGGFHKDQAPHMLALRRYSSLEIVNSDMMRGDQDL